MGLSCSLFGHQWNHCKCTRCGEIRKPDKSMPDPHDWNGCTCRVCGKKREEGHRYKNGVCEVCGKRLNKEEILKAFVPSNRYRGFTPPELEERNLKQLIESAYAILPQKDADEILKRAFHIIAFIVKDESSPVIDGLLKKHIVPFVDERTVSVLYEWNNRFRCLARVLDRDFVIQCCHNADWDTEKKKTFLYECKIVDNDLIKPCDIGEHQYERIGSRWSEKSGTSDTVDVSYEYIRYRCKICGHETERASGRSSL